MGPKTAQGSVLLVLDMSINRQGSHRLSTGTLRGSGLSIIIINKKNWNKGHSNTGRLQQDGGLNFEMPDMVPAVRGYVL
jgi:hypothetical protein